MKGQWLRLAALWVRDAVLVAVTLWLWSHLPHVNDATSIALHIAAALMTALSGYLVHEWGHLLGAWIAGSTYRLPAHPFETFFLFRFDNLNNSRAQYFTMGMGGFAASLLMVALLLWQLPAGVLASWIALGLTAAGVLATFIIEVPEVWRVWRGAPIPDGAAFVHPGVNAEATLSSSGERSIRR